MFGYAFSVWVLGLAGFNVSANSACVVEPGIEQHVDTRLPVWEKARRRVESLWPA